MAQVVVTLKIMPKSPEVDFTPIEAEVRQRIQEFSGIVARVEQEPVAFGLKALKILFTMDEDKGSTENLENGIAGIAGVNSVMVTDVRRTMG